MRIISTGVVFLLTFAGVTQAQSSPPLSIDLGIYSANPDGGEKARGMWRGTGPIVMGRTVVSTFSFGATCDAWTISAAKSGARADATTAWHIEMTPIRVTGDAVTFRLRSVRVGTIKQQLEQIAPEGGNDFRERLMALRPPSEDIELTLRPGESWPVDSVQVPPGAKTVHGNPCGRSESIRVLVNHYPGEGEERRLVAAELWLVERLANGTEAQRSQPITVRGLPSRPLQFFFDSIVDDKVTLDIYGTLVSRPETDALAVEIDTRSRWTPGSPRFYGPQRFFESKIQVKPAETVEVRLPQWGDEAGPFARREFSIRIRARQLR